MKTQSRLPILTVTAITAVFITQARAQYRAASNDGIAASPKVRAMLNERVQPSTGVVANYASFQTPDARDIAASPKVRQMLAERQATLTVPQGAAMVSAEPRNSDGIAASPRLRAQLNERGSSQVQVAPLK